ncbi:MAG: hypothetical protein [Caudoviricetes sp.]|nr:MAG: hypothetical protein [Caudoviricetes sp.]
MRKDLFWYLIILLVCFSVIETYPHIKENLKSSQRVPITMGVPVR